MRVAQEFVVRGGIDYAKKMLYGAFGPEIAKRLLDRLSKSLGTDFATFDALQKADPADGGGEGGADASAGEAPADGDKQG